MAEPIVIGIDLGATTVRMGAFTPAGKLLLSSTGEIHALVGPDEGLKRIASLVSGLKTELCDKVLIGIGVGSTGPTDSATGRILNPLTMPGWIDVPIGDYLGSRFQVPVCLENDADAAALGEYWQGAARHLPDQPAVRRLYAVTVGTGIGTAFILDGQVYRGADGFHPEGGHQIVDPSGPACYCGAHGCWESLCSGTAIGAQAQAALEASPPEPEQPGWVLFRMAENRVERVTARLVCEAARQGDALAEAVVARAADWFANGIFNILMLFHPEMIVLSGGVMRSADLFAPAVEQALENASGYIPSRRIQIRPANLGYFAGIYGAAFAVLQKIQAKDETEKNEKV